MYLFRQISRPNNQKLRKSEVGPEHDQRQQQFSKIVKVKLPDDVVHRLVFRQRRHHRHHERQRTQRPGGDKNKTVDGGRPKRIE